MAQEIRGRNEGSFDRRANGSWRAQIFTERKRINKVFESKLEVQTWLRTMQTKIDHGFWPLLWKDQMR